MEVANLRFGDFNSHRDYLLNIADLEIGQPELHQKYVDTMVKPYNNGLLTNQQINDAYAGLYEFAAWVMNK